MTEEQRKYIAVAWVERSELEERYDNLKNVYWHLRLTWRQLTWLGRAAAKAGVPMPCAYLPTSSIADARQAAQAALNELNAIDARINSACNTQIGAGREQTVPAGATELEWLSLAGDGVPE